MKRRKNASPYKGGFIKGKNTSEYNRSYYQSNKDKWKDNRKHRDPRSALERGIAQTRRLVQREAGMSMNEVDNIIGLFHEDPVVKFVKKFHNMLFNNDIIGNLRAAYKRIDWKKEIDTSSIEKSFEAAKQAFGNGLEALKKTSKK